MNEQLVIDHMPLAYHIANRLTPFVREREEAHGDALEGLVRAANTWDGNVKFGTYAGGMIQRAVIDAYRRRREGTRRNPLPNPASIEWLHEKGWDPPAADRTDAIACSTLPDHVEDVIDSLGPGARELLLCEYGKSNDVLDHRRQRLRNRLRRAVA